MLVICSIHLSLLVEMYGLITGAIKSTMAVIRKEERQSDLKKVCKIFAGALSYLINILSAVQHQC